MNEKIISEVADYTTAYERYQDSIENRLLIDNLSRIYNELLDIAEENACDYDKFNKKFLDNRIHKRFRLEIEKCKKEFKKYL